jgi:hypothetical protein
VIGASAVATPPSSEYWSLATPASSVAMRVTETGLVRCQLALPSAGVVTVALRVGAAAAGIDKAIAARADTPSGFIAAPVLLKILCMTLSPESDRDLWGEPRPNECYSRAAGVTRQ